MTTSPRRGTGLLAVLVVAVALLTGCGVPNGGNGDSVTPNGVIPGPGLSPGLASPAPN